MDLDRNGLRILDVAECVTFLGTSRLGRIALSRSALPTIMPVLYEVGGRAVTFHASGGLLEAAAERGDIVCFEADCFDASEDRLWSVLVVGKLEVSISSISALAPAVKGRFGTRLVSLPMTIVTGRASPRPM